MDQREGKAFVPQDRTSQLEREVEELKNSLAYMKENVPGISTSCSLQLRVVCLEVVWECMDMIFGVWFMAMVGLQHPKHVIVYALLIVAQVFMVMYGGQCMLMLWACQSPVQEALVWGLSLSLVKMRFMVDGGLMVDLQWQRRFLGMMAVAARLTFRRWRRMLRQ